jgi:hypothetical protein
LFFLPSNIAPCVYCFVLGGCRVIHIHQTANVFGSVSVCLRVKSIVFETRYTSGGILFRISA